MEKNEERIQKYKSEIDMEKIMEKMEREIEMKKIIGEIGYNERK